MCLSLLLAGPLAANEAEQTSSGPLHLHGPSLLVLGVFTTAALTATSPSAVEFHASVGTVSAPVRGADQRWHATYTPPATRFPQVTIVSARNLAGDVDWIPIPLYGVGEVETHTRPNAEITLAIGGKTFGPFRTDGRGAARSPVIAPPGIDRGITRTVDASGAARETPFDLGTPPFSRLAALCTEGTVYVFAVASDGTPDPQLQPSLTVKHGALTVPQALGQGAWVAHWLAGPDDVAEDVLGRIGNDPAQRLCTVPAPSEPPSGLQLTVDRTRYRAGSGPVMVRAELTYRTRRPPLMVPVELSSDGGVIEADRRDGNAVLARFRPKDHFDGRTSVVIRARVEAPALTATVELTLAAGPISKLIAYGPGRLLESGVTSAAVHVEAKDTWGNPADASAVVATTSGQVAASQLQPLGRATFAYVPLRTSRWTDRVTVRDPASGASASIIVALQRPPTRFLVAARLGYLTNFGKLSAPFVALDAGYRLPWLRRRLSIGLEAGFYDASYREANLSVVFLGIPVLARVGYSVPFGRAALYGGVGGGVMLTHVTTRATQLVDQVSTGTLGLFAAHLGLDFDVQVGRLLVEGGYFYAPSGDRVVSGNFGGLTVTAGYRVNL